MIRRKPKGMGKKEIKKTKEIRNFKHGKQNYTIGDANQFNYVDNMTSYYENEFASKDADFDTLVQKYKEKYLLTVENTKDKEFQEGKLESYDEKVRTKLISKKERYEAISEDKAALNEISKSKYSKNGSGERRRAFRAASKRFDIVDKQHQKVNQLLLRFHQAGAEHSARSKRDSVEEMERSARDVASRMTTVASLGDLEKQCIKDDFKAETEILNENLNLLRLRLEAMETAARGKEQGDSHIKVKIFAANLKISYATVGVLDEYMKNTAKTYPCVVRI